MEIEKIISELTFKAVRSSGPGGQNVNKVASKIVLSFELIKSQGLSVVEKELLKFKIANKLTNDGVLIIHCDENRSQFKNKEIAIKRFLKILKSGLIISTVRKETHVPKSIIKKRLKDKKTLSLTKLTRKKPNIDGSY